MGLANQCYSVSERFGLSSVRLGCGGGVCMVGVFCIQYMLVLICGMSSASKMYINVTSKNDLVGVQICLLVYSDQEVPV